MATRFTTQRRRAQQVLWSCLDQHLSPLVEGGLCLAISGGPDSRALLESVSSWPSLRAGKCVAAVVDHGMRLDSRPEADFIALRAKRLGFDCMVATLANIEEHSGEHDLRSARYRELVRIARLNNCKSICTAHQADDDAEGYLMSIMGCGGGALGAGMSEISYIEDLVLCRPFLSLNKNDLLLSLSLMGITDSVTDFIDEAKIGRRAFVRHEIIPSLTKYAPTIKEKISLVAKGQRVQNAFVEKSVLSSIVWRDDIAEFALDEATEKGAVVSVVWQILKKWSSGKDLRSCQPTVLKIAAECTKDHHLRRVKQAGLDPTSNKFKLNSLKAKQYQLPGVVVQTRVTQLIARRI